MKARIKPKKVEVCAVGTTGECLDKTVRELNSEGWYIRQVFQESGSAYYRVFAQRTMGGTDDAVLAA